ncbi:hypothetical protein N0V84_003299 [Fusarium piperis]|uniref:Protein kinase domain-containing protein n=1 Tax=Fusarium piperis TaxID=1435070 RepID=A0A9W8WI32_9HYPO|nr:hypothetical protein N0V84_003299 [Fusarium piperis]
MGEETRLLSLGISPDRIWGDKNDTIVYAQVLRVKRGGAIIFRFYRNPLQSPKSLSNRVVNHYHDIEVPDATFGFRDRAAMRSAIWSSIATVWRSCAITPNIFAPGTVIDISSHESEGSIWCLYRSPLFYQYLGLLRRIQRSDLVPASSSAPTTDISQIHLLEPTGGGGHSRRALIHRGSGISTSFIFKGIDFATYLQLRDDDNKSVRAMVKAWRRSSKLIVDMAPHPSIQPPPEMLVTVRDLNGEEVLMGHLSTLLSTGNLAAVIERINRLEVSISLQEKATWCRQMALAVAHAHHVLHTFHMNVKPESFLVDVGLNLLLADWEQSGASATTLAPEADGTWDVKEETTDGGTKLVYTKYTGPPRRNMPQGSGPATSPAWNVFPKWQANFPRATELAEVFSLGRTMWMLLTQTVGEFDDVKHPDDIRVTWVGAKNLPSHWIEMVERCMEHDPNKRPGLENLVKFWKNEESLLERNL